MESARGREGQEEGRDRERGLVSKTSKREGFFSGEDNNVVGLRAVKQDKKLTPNWILKFRIYR